MNQRAPFSIAFALIVAVGGSGPALHAQPAKDARFDALAALEGTYLAAVNWEATAGLCRDKNSIQILPTSTTTTALVATRLLPLIPTRFLTDRLGRSTPVQVCTL
jgi:hypothetical protein